MECLICGREFETFKTRGMKPKYCSDECKRKASYKSHKKYMAKRRAEKALKRRTSRIEEETKQVEYIVSDDYIRKDEVICRKEEASLYSTKYVSDVVELGRKLGAVLFEAKEIKEKLSKEQSEMDKIGHEILLFYEHPREITVEKAIEIAKKAGNMRTPRRDVKVLIEIIDNLIRNIPSNPPAFVARAIQNKEKTSEFFANKEEANSGLL